MKEEPYPTSSSGLHGWVTTLGSASTIYTSPCVTIGQIDLDFKNKIIKVYDGEKWVEVKMSCKEKTTEELLEIVSKEIKKEIYG